MGILGLDPHGAKSMRVWGWVLGVGRWVLGVGCWVLVVGVGGLFFGVWGLGPAGGEEREGCEEHREVYRQHPALGLRV